MLLLLMKALVLTCSVPPGSCPNLMTSNSEARGEKPGEVVSAAPQPGRTPRSPRWSPSAGRDGPNQGWRSGLGVQVGTCCMPVSLLGVRVLGMCKALRALLSVGGLGSQCLLASPCTSS